jgi:hypothetical protein
MEQFISDSPVKTPAMKVNIIQNKKIIESYDAPSGFQLEKYVGSIHPHATLQICFPQDESGKCFKVDVCDDNMQVTETHLGIYYKE